MGETIGRAGFHAVHAKAVGDRGAILHEAMRELDPAAVAYWAERNPSIVVADERLNEAMVNDGKGGFRACSKWSEVIDYGAERVGRVNRAFREDKKNPKTGKMEGGTVTTSLLVSHLPKSLCVEVPDFYPRLNKDGSPMLDPETGEPLLRSRWVARDRDEARRYFEEVIAFMAAEAIPGGHAAVLGYDIQHSESTPHVQIIADTFDDDPDEPGALRQSWSRGWSSHDDVRNDKGQKISGKAKMRDYHAGLKQHLIGKGFDVSPDYDEERHMLGYSKEHYGEVMDAQRKAEVALDHVGLRKKALSSMAADLGAQQDELDQRDDDLDAREEDIVQTEFDQAGTAQRLARVEAELFEADRAEGYLAGRQEAAEWARETEELHGSALAARERADEQEKAAKLDREAAAAELRDLRYWLDAPRQGRDGKPVPTHRQLFEQFTRRQAEKRAISAAADAPDANAPQLGYDGPRVQR